MDEKNRIFLRPKSLQRNYQTSASSPTNNCCASYNAYHSTSYSTSCSATPQTPVAPSGEATFTLSADPKQLPPIQTDIPVANEVNLALSALNPELERARDAAHREAIPASTPPVQPPAQPTTPVQPTTPAPSAPEQPASPGPTFTLSAAEPTQPTFTLSAAPATTNTAPTFTLSAAPPTAVTPIFTLSAAPTEASTPTFTLSAEPQPLPPIPTEDPSTNKLNKDIAKVNVKIEEARDAAVKVNEAPYALSAVTYEGMRPGVKPGTVVVMYSATIPPPPRKSKKPSELEKKVESAPKEDAEPPKVYTPPVAEKPKEKSPEKPKKDYQASDPVTNTPASSAPETNSSTPKETSSIDTVIVDTNEGAATPTQIAPATNPSYAKETNTPYGATTQATSTAASPVAFSGGESSNAQLDLYEDRVTRKTNETWKEYDKRSNNEIKKINGSVNWINKINNVTFMLNKWWGSNATERKEEQYQKDLKKHGIELDKPKLKIPPGMSEDSPYLTKRLKVQYEV